MSVETAELPSANSALEKLAKHIGAYAVDNKQKTEKYVLNKAEREILEAAGVTIKEED
jgi:hypothetical protein